MAATAGIAMNVKAQYRTQSGSIASDCWMKGMGVKSFEISHKRPSSA